MQLPSIDIFVGLFFLMGIAYGFLFQREKTITTLCAVYIGLVVATNFSATIYDFFNGNKMIAGQVWIRGNASTSTIAIILFLLTTFLISRSINSKNTKSDGTSALEIIVYSALTVALILSAILGYLPEAIRSHYITAARSVRYLYDYRSLFVILPPIMLIVMNWRKKTK